MPSLKSWVQPGVSHETTITIGAALGRFLANVHNLTAGAQQALSPFTGNSTAKSLIGTLYFGRLAMAAAKRGYREDYIREAAKVAEKEFLESSEVLTLGDYWPGNVLVSTNESQDLRLYVIDLEFTKPGTAAFDIGQMAAEMYCLAAFRDHELGTSLLNAFLRTYKECRQAKVNAAQVAIRIAAHFMVVSPNTWLNDSTPESVKELTDMGRDLIRMGWENDQAGLRRSIIGTLMDV